MTTGSTLQGDLREELRAEAKRIQEDAEFTGREHLELGRLWRTASTAIGLPAVVLAAVTSGAAGLSALTNGDPKVTAGLAFASALITSIRVFFRPDEQAQDHSTKGGRYINLRNRARRFANIDVTGSLSTDALQERLDRLAEDQEALRLTPPREIPDFIYQRVKRQIEAGNYTHKVDADGSGGK